MWRLVLHQTSPGLNTRVVGFPYKALSGEGFTRASERGIALGARHSPFALTRNLCARADSAMQLALAHMNDARNSLSGE
jgi:hypothetical protein